MYLVKTCLEAVRAHYETTGKRARVADLGTGFGTMTWKLLAAGAEVDAFERQKPTADELVNSTIVSAYDQDDMRKYAIAMRTNAYHREHQGPIGLFRS